jgi:hypothetical protein
MEEIAHVYIHLKSKRDKPLPQRDINGINRLLMKLDGKRIPNGTYAFAAADKIEEDFKKQNPRAKWSFGSEYKVLTDDMAGKIQRNVRKRAAQNTVDKVRHKSLLTNVIEEAQQKGNKVKRALFSPDTLQSPKGNKKRIPISQQKIKFPTPSFGLTPSKVLKSRTTTPVSPDNDSSALDPTDEDIQQQAAGGGGKATANQSNQYMQDLVKKHVPTATTIQSFKGNKGDIPEALNADIYTHFGHLFTDKNNLNDVYEWWVKGSPKKADKASFVTTPSSAESAPSTPVRVKALVEDVITKFIGDSPRALKDNEERIPEELRKQIAATSGKPFKDKATLKQMYTWWSKLGKQTKV